MLEDIRNLLFGKMLKSQKAAENVGLLLQRKSALDPSEPGGIHREGTSARDRQSRAEGCLGSIHISARLKGGVCSLEMGTCMGSGGCGREEREIPVR